MFSRKKQVDNKEDELLELIEYLYSSGLTDNFPTNSGIRLAVELYNKWEMSMNYSWGGVTVYLDKSQWRNQINLSVPSYKYQTLYKDLSDWDKINMQNIAGFGGRSFELAVFMCLKNARIAGVI